MRLRIAKEWCHEKQQEIVDPQRNTK